MKIMHIEVRRKFELKKIKLALLDKLPGKTVSLAATVQYLNLIPKIKKYLEEKGKKVIIKKGAYHKAHVLGCNASAFDKNSDILLLLADGKFHALNNALQLNKEIYIFNTKTLEKVTKQEISKIKQKTKGKIKKFFAAERIGILISTKFGQHYKLTQELKKRIQKLGKKVYVFESDIINTAELENFPDIQIWVNTACPGIALDSPKIVNLNNVLEFLK